MVRLKRFATIVSTLALLTVASAAQAETLRFAVYGDMPYTAGEQAFLSGRASEEIARDDRISFVIALGDLGRPEGYPKDATPDVRLKTTACTDDWQVAQRRLWRDGFRKPVFLTPGDNDWTDCDADRVPRPVSELSRLDALRRIHFSGPPPSVDPIWRYRAQPAQPENATWFVAGVRFATLHMVGTGNGRRRIERDDKDVALALADARDASNLAWLAEVFGTARAEEATAVVVAMQVDPFDPGKNKDDPNMALPLSRCLAQPAFAPVCRALALQALTFRGPVLLVHGDTNPACLEEIDSADGHRLFWRLNAWGDFTLLPDITVIDVDAENPYKPFKVSGLVQDGAMPGTCNY